MSCYRICQADLTCTCIHIYSDNIQKCDERLKSANHTTPRQMRMCCIVIYPCRVLVYILYILVSTLVTPDFFSRFFVCYSAIFVLFKRGLIIPSRESTRLLSTYDVCCDQLVNPRRRRRRTKSKVSKPSITFLSRSYFPLSFRETPSLSFPPLSLSVPVHISPPFPNTKPQWLCIGNASPPPPNHHTSTLPPIHPPTSSPRID